MKKLLQFILGITTLVTCFMIVISIFVSFAVGTLLNVYTGWMVVSFYATLLSYGSLRYFYYTQKDKPKQDEVDHVENTIL